MGTEAERVGEEVTAVVESANTSASAAVEEAKRKVDEATKTAEQIAAAAIHTDIGARVAKHEEEFTNWRADRETLHSRLGNLETQNQRMADLVSSQSLILEKLTQPQQNPEPVTAVVIPEAEKSGSTKTEASQKSEEEKPDGKAKEPAKRQRLWM